MTSAVLTLCLAAVGFTAAQMLGQGGTLLILLAIVVAGPYMLGVRPRTTRDWFAVKVCVTWLMIWLFVPWTRLISR